MLMKLTFYLHCAPKSILTQPAQNITFIAITGGKDVGILFVKSTPGHASKDKKLERKKVE